MKSYKAVAFHRAFTKEGTPYNATTHVRFTCKPSERFGIAYRKLSAEIGHCDFNLRRNQVIWER